jgi:hypothetical protein
MVITVGPDLEAALNDLARKQGVAPEGLALPGQSHHYSREKTSL